jgi:phenylacetate-CoA ligase
MIKQYGFSVPIKLKAVLFASEKIYAWQRKITQSVFDCRIFSHYGNAEKVVLGAECENTNRYHCIPQYGICEINNETKEIIGTSFLNYVNPFIRYRTTDIASQQVSLGCSECGRQYYPVFSGVEGRLEDFIITPNGVPISPAVITYPFKDLTTIRNTQIIQKSLDCIRLMIVLWDNCNRKIFKSELQALCQSLKNILGSKMRIEIEIVVSIQLNKSGTFKWIISEVSKYLLQKV